MEESRLRTSLVPGLLRNVEYNFARGARDVRLFELGTVFHAAGASEPPREDLHVAFVVTGRREPEHWSGGGEALDFWSVKDLVETVLTESGWHDAGVEVPEEAAGDLFVAASSITLMADGARTGAAGQVRPDRIDAPAWAGEVWAMELTLPGEPAARPTPTYRPLSPFPAVDRDLALLGP